HRLIGVEHFYLYNDHSQDNFREVLQLYIQAGIVELFNCPEKTQLRIDHNIKQKKRYVDAVKRAKGVSKWVAFIDIDEFIFPVKDKALPKFLSRYEEYGAVTVNWQIFGTSYVEQLRKDQLMIEQLILRAETDFKYNHDVK